MDKRVERVKKLTNNIVKDIVSGYDCSLRSLIKTDCGEFNRVGVSMVCKNCRNNIGDSMCSKVVFDNIYYLHIIL